MLTTKEQFLDQVRRLGKHFEAMPFSLGFDGSPCFGTWPFGLPSPYREKGTPSCPVYRVVKGFFGVVVLTWLHVAYQT